MDSQFYWLGLTGQQVRSNLLISSSWNKSVKIWLVATCHMRTCYNLLKQLAVSLWKTSSDNQLSTSPLTIRDRPVVNKHANTSWYRLFITTLLQDVNSNLCVFGGVVKVSVLTSLSILLLILCRNCWWKGIGEWRGLKLDCSSFWIPSTSSSLASSSKKTTDIQK